MTRVAGRLCQGWNISVGRLRLEVSVDESLELPMPEPAYMRMVRASAAPFVLSGPIGASYKRLFEELAKLKGLPLKTHLTGLMGLEISTEATRIEDGPVATWRAGTALPVSFHGVWQG